MGGSLGFSIDKKYSNAKRFLKDVRGLKREYSFVDLDVHQCGDKRCVIEGSYGLHLDQSDLTHPEAISDEKVIAHGHILFEDPLVVLIKKAYQVRTADGQQRIAEYKRVWADFMEIAKAYVT